MKFFIILVSLVFSDNCSFKAAEPTEEPAVVISYRKTTSRELAMLVKIMLEKYNISACMDMDKIEDKRSHSTVNVSSNIIILSFKSLDPCIGDTNYNDYLHKQIRDAVHSNSTRIIPIFDEYNFPPVDNFSTEIKTMMKYQGVLWEHDLADGSIKKVIGYLKDERLLTKNKRKSTKATAAHRVFIAYRRSSSRHLALMMKLLMEKRNVSAFLDVENLRGGFWDSQLITALHKARNVVIILSVGTLDRCIGDIDFNDNLHKEIKEVVQLNSTRILPVFDQYDFPPLHLFSEEIQIMMQSEGVVWDSVRVSDSIENILHRLQ